MSLTHLLAFLGLVASAGTKPAPADAVDVTPTTAMTLEEALDYATVHSPLLAAARDQLAQNEKALEAPKSRWLPSFGAGAELLAATVNDTTNVTASIPSVAIPRIGGRAYNPTHTFDNGQSWHPYPSSFIGVGVTQQIFDFGTTAARVASADAAALAGRHDLEGTRLDIQLTVTVAFTAVQAAHGVLNAANAAVLRAAAQRDQAAAMVQNQLRSRIYLERVEADLSRLKVGALRAEAGVANAQSAFANAVGLDEPLLDARGATLMPPPMPTREQAVTSALANDPRIQSIAAQLRSQHEAANGIGDFARPNIFLTGTLSARSGGAPITGLATPQYGGWLPETPNWDVGIIASWSFFDPVVQAEARAAHAQENVLSDQLANARQVARAFAQDAWVKSAEAQRALPELTRAYDAAKENYAQADVRFREGLGTSVEIADAQSLLTDSEVQLTVGQFEVARSRAELTRAMGGGN
jgi:outer membrane protein TolC